MDGFAERVAAWVGKGSTVKAAAVAGENGAPEQASEPMRAPQGGDGDAHGASDASQEAVLQALQSTAASIAVLGSEEGEMESSERRAPHNGVSQQFRICTSWGPGVCAHALRAAHCPACQLQATSQLRRPGLWQASSITLSLSRPISALSGLWCLAVVLPCHVPACLGSGMQDVRHTILYYKCTAMDPHGAA